MSERGGGECTYCFGDGKVSGPTWSQGAYVELVSDCPICEGSGIEPGECRDCSAGTPAETLTTNRGLCWHCQPYEDPAIAKADAEYDRRKDERGVA